MKKIQKDLQRRSFKLHYHINTHFCQNWPPTANFDLYLNFGNADFGLHGVYHVTYQKHSSKIKLTVFIPHFYVFFSFLPAAYITVQVHTESDGKPVLLQRKTKRSKYTTKDVVFKVALSFNLAEPLWKTMRERTTLTVLMHGCDYLFRSHKLGRVDIGLDVDDSRAAQHWDDVTRSPYKFIKCTHSMYDYYHD